VGRRLSGRCPESGRTITVSKIQERFVIAGALAPPMAISRTCYRAASSSPPNKERVTMTQLHDPKSLPASTARRRRWSSAALAVCLLAGPACDEGGDHEWADGETEGEDEPDEAQTDRITNGFNAPSYFWNSVVRLANGCTGTLIGETYVLTAGHCVPRPTIAGGVVPGTWYSFTAGVPGPSIQVGPTVGSPVLTRTVTQFNEAGFDDILLLRLSATVPASFATASPPITDIPGGGVALPWLQSQSFDMAGFGLVDGGAPATQRQRADATVAEFPFVSFGTLQPNMLRAVGDDCATVQPGDSGSPLLWFDYATNVLRMVGVAQGVEGCGGRYVTTFGVGGVDGAGNAKPNIGDWLETTIPVDFVVDGNIDVGCTSSGGSPTVLVRVKNQGLTAASGWVDLFLDLPAPPPIGTFSSMFKSSGTLAPGQSKLLTFVVPDSWETQSVWVDILLDTTQSHAEDKENNNHKDRFVTFPDCSFN
jgi:hypothetical protein